MYKFFPSQMLAGKQIVRKWQRYRGAALFADPGTGKTRVTLESLRLFTEHNLIKNVLIVAPLRVARLVWPQEIVKWEYGDYFTWTVLHGRDRKPSEIDNRDVNCHVINPHGLEWLKEQKINYDAVVIDESTDFKNWSAKRTKALKKVLQKNPKSYRLILTGTPTPNSFADLFSQIYLVDRGESLGKVYYRFKNKYLIQTGRPEWHQYVFNTHLKEVLLSDIEHLVVRMVSDQDRPGIIHNPVWIDLPPDARRIYNDMEQSLFADIADGNISTPSAGGKYQICRQIANGGAYQAEEKEYINRYGDYSVKRVRGESIQIHYEKTNVVKEYSASLYDKPLMISYLYYHDLEKLQAKIDKNLPVINGRVKLDVAEKLNNDWNEDKLKHLALHPKAASHGLNLQYSECQDIMHVGIPNQADVYKQVNGRLDRTNQTRQIRSHVILARDTVNEAEYEALQAKTNLQQHLLDYYERKS